MQSYIYFKIRNKCYEPILIKNMLREQCFLVNSHQIPMREQANKFIIRIKLECFVIPCMRNEEIKYKYAKRDAKQVCHSYVCNVQQKTSTLAKK